MKKHRLPPPAETFIDAPECGPLPALWQWWQSSDTGARYDRFLLQGTAGIRNTKDITAAEHVFRKRTATWDLKPIPLPPEIPPCRVTLPPKSFSPDFFFHGSHMFASRRLRDALAQPPEVVEFIPIELLSDSEAAHAQDYRLMRVLAEQPAMDFDRSDTGVKHLENWVTGERIPRADYPYALVLHEDFHPRNALFRVEEDPTTILATDALALRVLKAGCTGVAFEDFGVNTRSKHTVRRRTLTGLALLRVGYLD